MNQTAMLMNMVPVVGVREVITAGQQATWACASAATTQEAALARTVADNEAFPAVNTPAWDAMNERRAELIRKDLDEGLTPAERQECERLQRLSLAAAVKAFPRPKPDFEELARLRKELGATSVPVTE